jgi:sulfur transfer protein SufE
MVEYFQEELNKCVKKADAYRQIIEVSKKQIELLQEDVEDFKESVSGKADCKEGTFTKIGEMKNSEKK